MSANLLEWKALWDAMRAALPTGAWVPTTPAMRDAMLNAVPPRCYFPGGFLVGEPWADDENGEPLYAAFRGWGEEVEARYLTVRAAKGGAR
jgi:hypothetical protein